MIRNRDIVALVMIVILSRMAWDESTESLSASANLAFYFPRKSTTSAVVSAMDLDGDGTNEALAVVSPMSQSSWVLEVLDLKRLHQQRKSTLLAPFRPSVLFTSKPVTLTTPKDENTSVAPIKLSAGHLVLASSQTTTNQVHPKAQGNPDINDSNRHYFCGTDWHDASERCGVPCPGGQSSECPDNERCFADTPCDIMNVQMPQVQDSSVEYRLTPGGGLPSLMTLWSNGDLTLHSLLQETESEEQQTKKRRVRNKELELRQQWQVNTFPPNTNASDSILWEEANILFLDTYSSQQAGAENGMIVVSGTYYLDGANKRGSNSFVVALDALTGKLLWDNFINGDLFSVEDAPLLPLVRGTNSFARRRSRVPALQEEHDRLEVLPNCAVVLKHHLKEILPFSYWGSQDASLKATHLDWKKRDHHKRHHQQSSKQKDRRTSKLSPYKKAGSKHKHPILGRPNVLVVQSQGGLQIRSLKNGSPLCHMNLNEDTVYSDLNNDGIIDQVQLLLDSKRGSSPSNEQWIQQLADKIKNTRKDLKEKGATQNLLKTHPNLCHAMVLSGVPANEELFSTSLCRTSRGNADSLGEYPVGPSLDYVAPIVVESLSGRRNTRDIIVALNNGMVHRLQGRSGRREWSTIGSRHYDNFPTWEMTKENSNALLARLPSKNVVPAVQPVLLAGENSLAILSVKNGALLASATFPQTSIGRPVLAEVSGDGTTDVLVLSTDGIWGYHLSVYPGSRVALRIMTGLLFLGLLLAVLTNRFGQKKGKRSTDI
eukprot:scaffold22692_cov198-Cylindrotheca_fusiformis.AAC.1